MDGFLATAFVMGLLGSAHCAGMCGPLALAVPSPGRSPAARWAGTLLLNTGRLASYTALGAAFGLFGNGLRLAGLQQTVSILLGAAILLGLLLPRLAAKLPHSPAWGVILIRLQGTLARHLRRTSPEALFFTGMLNGLLPCGLVWLAGAGAMAQHTAAHGAWFMAAFGLGTWPALVALRLGGHRLGQGSRRWLRRAAPFAYALMGALLILRGLDLGIPWIGPSLHTAPQACP